MVKHVAVHLYLYAIDTDMKKEKKAPAWHDMEAAAELAS